MWNTEHELVGSKVAIYTDFDDEETATVLAVHNNGNIKVKSEIDGEILIGNQWENLD